jgi:hypothetical protein
MLSSHLCLGLPSGLLPSGLPTKTLLTLLPYPMRATCPAHLILLDLITLTIFGEEYIIMQFSPRSVFLPSAKLGNESLQSKNPKCEVLRWK